MITRRDVIAGTAGAVILRTTIAGAELPGAAGPPDALVALPGKKPQIKRTLRAPNFETPLADLRRQYTANDAFFVRYHLAVIPEIDPHTWTLRIGGASAQRPLEFSLATLKHGFE